MDMIEQYRQETSQIHAPADLVRRTKCAMQAEEGRICQEDKKSNPAIQMPGTSCHKLYKWALTASAAVVLVLLFRASSGMVKDSIHKAEMSDGSGMTSGGEEADMMEDTEQFTGADAGMAENAEQSSGVSANLESEAVDFAKSDMSDQMEDSVEENIDMAADTEGARTQGTEASAMKELEVKENSTLDRSMPLSISEVNELPSFYHNPDTERIVFNGKAFYVAKGQNNEWSAYVRVNGKRYVIACENNVVADQEDFIQKAFELLAETVEGAE